MSDSEDESIEVSRKLSRRKRNFRATAAKKRSNSINDLSEGEAGKPLANASSLPDIEPTVRSAMNAPGLVASDSAVSSESGVKPPRKILKMTSGMSGSSCNTRSGGEQAPSDNRYDIYINRHGLPTSGASADPAKTLAVQVNFEPERTA